MSQHQVLVVTWLSLSLEVRAIIVVGGQNNPDRERSRLPLSREVRIILTVGGQATIVEGGQNNPDCGKSGYHCRGRSE